MNHMIRIVLAVLALILLSSTEYARAEVNAYRDPVINFQGKLADAIGLAADGQVSVVARYYKDAKPESQSLYGEMFDQIAVDKGNFRLPLLQGQATSGNKLLVTTQTESMLFVDIDVDGSNVLERYPVKNPYGAIRAEKASYAYALKDDFKLTNEQIPDHDASKVTSGTLAIARIPSLNIRKFTQGTLTYNQIPQISATKIATGTFPEKLLPDVLDASIVTSGTLKDEVLPTDIVLKNNFYVASGTLGHLGMIPIPMGFTKDYCQWVVGIKKIEGSGGIDQFRVYTDQNGIVTCRWSPEEADAELNHYCQASYMLVCMK